MTTLAERLTEDMKQAMKAQDKVTLSVIRMVRTAIKNAEIDAKKALDDDGIITVLARELKQRKDSLEAFLNAKRDDLVADVNAEIEVLKKYLPAQMDEAEIIALVKQVIAEIGAKGMSDMGKIMGRLAPVTKGKADGKLVNQIVRSELSNL